MMQVAIVHHLDMPIMRQRAFHIAPGTENQIPITPTLYTANPQVMSVFTSKFTKLGHSNDFTYSIFVFVESLHCTDCYLQCTKFQFKRGKVTD